MPSKKTDAAPTATEIRFSESPSPSKADVAPPSVPSYLEDPVLQRVYNIGSFLGKGGFAWCYEATDIRSLIIYALKVVPKARLTKPHHTEKVMREISIHYPLRHKHVVRLYSAFEDYSNIYMVLEFCPMQSLVHVLKKRGYLREEEVRFYIRQLILGVRYLHEEKRILHRDLKLGNMLLSQDMCVKIADFGLAIDFSSSYERSVTLCGTPNYIAPEILNKQGHSYATEAWAIGCIMYAMLVGNPPFETNSLEETYSLIMQCRYSIPDSISYQAKDLIRLLLHPDPARRSLTSPDLLNHSFFKNGYIPCSLSPSCAQISPTFPIENNYAQITRKPLAPTNNVKMTSTTNGHIVKPNKNLHSTGFGSHLIRLHEAISGSVIFTKSVHPSMNNCKFNTTTLMKIIPTNGIIYVTKWIDYSNRHGFGMEYNNGIVGVVFNDGCSVLLSADRLKGRFVPSISTKSLAKEFCFDMAKISDDMLERIQTVNVFANYMDKNLISAGVDFGTTINDFNQVPYSVHWRRHSDCIVIVLSDGTFQANFTNSHIKVVLSPCDILDNPTDSSGYLITYIDPCRSSYTYSLSSLVQLLRHSPGLESVFVRVSELLREAAVYLAS